MKNILKYLFLIVAAACLSKSGGTICAANQQSGASGNTTEALARKPLANDNAFNTVAYRSLPALTVGGKEGVSAPFAGMSNGSLLVAGGCNFPGKPAAEGGEKCSIATSTNWRTPRQTNPTGKRQDNCPKRWPMVWRSLFPKASCASAAPTARKVPPKCFSSRSRKAASNA